MSPARPSLTHFAWLSIAAAILIIALKAWAYWLTGSVALLSDALESIINLVAAGVALFVLTVVARPADEDHPFGHDKAEYFSSGLEGGLILIAAIAIAAAAVNRLLHPQPLGALGMGLAISFVASVINLVVARVLLKAAQRHNSIALEADAKHLMTDVWTSAGVIVGLGAVTLTGWEWLDPIVAIGVALNIVKTGVDLLRRSVLGLMDTALPVEELAAIEQILERYKSQGIAYHALRTRQSGARRFVTMHVLVPGAWPVQRGHDLVEGIEQQICHRFPHASVLTHLEPLEDPASYADEEL
jgi:cation diffusion facilitator family transporter